MTQDYAVQNQRPSALPYALGGAAVGGVLGLPAVLGRFGVQTAKYGSWEEILKESKDVFDKQIEKGGDNKTLWENAKKYADDVVKAEDKVAKSMLDAIPEPLRGEEAAKTYVEKLKTLTSKKESVLEEIKTAIKEGKITKEGFDIEEYKTVESFDDIL